MWILWMSPRRPVAEELPRLLELRHRSLLRADLNDPAVFRLGFDDASSLLEIVGERLLAVDVLAGLAGRDRDRYVPVVRGRDDDRVHVLSIEQPLELLGFEDALFAPASCAARLA